MRHRAPRNISTHLHFPALSLQSGPPYGSTRRRRDAGTDRIDTSNATRYYPAVIRSFGDRDTRRLFAREPVTRWGPDLQRAALRKLRMLDAAIRADDLRVPPGNRLERLGGDRTGQWSIRINDQWRVCFRWSDGDAHDVAVVDYH